MIGPTVSAGIAIGLANGEATGALTIPIAGEIFSFTLPFPTGAPFSSGSAQIGKTKLNTTDLSFVSTDSYGNSPSNRAAWLIGVPFIPSPGPTFIAPSVPVVSLTMPTTQRRVNKTYKGLQMYNDNILKDNPWGIEAPYFLAGVVIDDEDIYRDTAPLKTVGSNTSPGSLIDNTNFFYLDDPRSPIRNSGPLQNRKSISADQWTWPISAVQMMPKNMAAHSIPTGKQDWYRQPMRIVCYL